MGGFRKSKARQQLVGRSRRGICPVDPVLASVRNDDSLHPYNRTISDNLADELRGSERRPQCLRLGEERGSTIHHQRVVDRILAGTLGSVLRLYGSRIVGVPSHCLKRRLNEPVLGVGFVDRRLARLTESVDAVRDLEDGLHQLLSVRHDRPQCT